MQQKNSWIPIPPESHFSINNLPFGIFSVGSNPKRVGVAIGEQILDLAGVAALGYFDQLNIGEQVFLQGTLNEFIALGKKVTSEVRELVQQWLSDPDSTLRSHDHLLVDQKQATLHMPLQVGDYTDFYSSLEHATNVGKMFRDPDNALLPNWKHLPVGYHGRSSSIVVSGVPIHRPRGQVLPQGAEHPVYQTSQRLDFELEMAFVIGKENDLGQPVPIDRAEEYIFGMVLFNDWSARDIQKWEYVPLGPFLGKNFASSISPWVISLEDLEPFRVKGPEQKPQVLPYLQHRGKKNYDINLDVSIITNSAAKTTLSQSNFKYMYWNMAQQLAHHTVNGCNVKVGDLMASGTISGPDPSSYGSMLELSWGGSNPVTLSDGSQRTFIEDFDTVAISGVCKKSGIVVGFGEVRNKILPAIDE